MSAEDFKRKLTAVLTADVAGYSRLMAEDEAATVKTIATYREVMASLIKQHRGRVVDSPGDNVLAEFASVVDAVQCGHNLLVGVQGLDSFSLIFTHKAAVARHIRTENSSELTFEFLRTHKITPQIQKPPMGHRFPLEASISASSGDIFS